MKLPVIYYGNPLLRKKCDPVESVTEEIKIFAQDLIETMKIYDGVGIAAPQVGKSLAMFVIWPHSKNEKNEWVEQEPVVFINPKILEIASEESVSSEGCLSIPKTYGDVSRPISVKVQALGIDGKEFTAEIDGYNARIFLHENDHINGVLFIDRMSKVERKKLEPRLREIKKKHAK